MGDRLEGGYGADLLIGGSFQQDPLHERRRLALRRPGAGRPARRARSRQPQRRHGERRPPRRARCGHRCTAGPETIGSLRRVIPRTDPDGQHTTSSPAGAAVTTSHSSIGQTECLAAKRSIAVDRRLARRSPWPHPRVPRRRRRQQLGFGRPLRATASVRFLACLERRWIEHRVPAPVGVQRVDGALRSRLGRKRHAACHAARRGGVPEPVSGLDEGRIPLRHRPPDHGHRRFRRDRHSDRHLRPGLEP